MQRWRRRRPPPALGGLTLPISRLGSPFLDSCLPAMPAPSSECVRVAVRCRPLSEREAGQRPVVSVDSAAGQVTLAPAGEPPRGFTFDRAFGPEVNQAQVYDACCRDLVDSALAGYNATLFAFGQTGTGKTHTMEGSGGGAGGGASSGLPPGAGVIPRTFRQIFDAIGASADQTFLVRASMLEIYNEEIRDLLSKVGCGCCMFSVVGWFAACPILQSRWINGNEQCPVWLQPCSGLKSCCAEPTRCYWHRTCYPAPVPDLLLSPTQPIEP